MPELLAFVGGFIVALFADPLREWIFRARPTLDFAVGDHYLTTTHEQGGHEAHYVRVRTTNQSSRVAKDCRAYLVNIERRGPDGKWEATAYAESLQLAWSGRGADAHSALDLPKDVPHFIDVVSTRAISTGFLPATSSHLFRYQSLYNSAGTYLFTVVLSGDNIRPRWIRILFEWSGDWDNFNVKSA